VPVVHQRIHLPDQTPVSMSNVQRNVNWCITGVTHHYGYVKVTWTYTRDPQDFVTAAAALVQDE